MTVYKVQGPSGATYDIEGPEGATADQLGQHILSQSKDERVALTTQQMRQEYAPTVGMGTGERLLAGAGRGMVSIGRAVGLPVEKLGLPGTEDAKTLDAPLLDTTAGKFGNVAGQATLLAPAALLPGANTYTGAALIGGGLGAATTEGGIEERAKGAIAGAAGGAVGKGLGDVVGAGISKLASMRANNLLAQQGARVGKDAAVEAAQNAGYVLPPTEANPSITNTVLEGLSGKIKTAQAASTKNQSVTNTLAAQELGIQGPITKEGLQGIRSKADGVYQELKQIGPVQADEAFVSKLAELKAPIQQFAGEFPELANKDVVKVLEAFDKTKFDGAASVEALKRLRFEGNANKILPDPGKKELGQIQTKVAQAFEDLLDRNIDAKASAVEASAPEMAASMRDLLGRFKDARTTIAKTYNVEKALNDSTGDISAKVLATQLVNGKPLSRNLKTIAEAGQAFPKATQTLQQPYNALSPLDFAHAGLTAAGMHNPLYAAGIVARPLTRAGILSGPYQRAIGPNYEPTVTNLLAGGAERALPYAPALAAGSAQASEKQRSQSRRP